MSIRCSGRAGLAILVVGAALGLLCGMARGAGIAYVDADLTTHDAWRTTDLAKPLDVDANNVYGSSGYALFGGAQGSSLPYYATAGVAVGTNTFGGNASYVYFDNAALTGPAPVANVMSGVVYASPGGAATENDLIEVVVTYDRSFRLGVITDNADVAAISPVSLRVRQTAGGSANSGPIPAATGRDKNGDFYFFDITGAKAGDKFMVSGVNDIGHGSNGLYGVTFDTAQAPPPTTANLWNVDIEGTSGVVMTGPLKIGGVVDQWNAFRVANWTGTTTNPSMSLKDTAGNATPVIFQIIGTVTGVNLTGTNNVVRDYLATNVTGTSSSLDWTLTGLTPGAKYLMWNYSGEIAGRQFNMTIDMDGDGSLLDESPVLVNSAGVLFSDIFSDAGGMIRGRMTSPDGNEDNWAGFQLQLISTSQGEDIPEPATLVMLSLGLLATGRYARRPLRTARRNP